jgi:hypothetical protein
MTAQGFDPGRRRNAEEGGRRVDVTTVLAVVLPLLTVGALAVVGDPVDTERDRPPTAAPLTRTTMVCPSPAEGGADGGTVALAHSDAELRGRVRQRVPRKGTVDLGAGGTTTLGAEQRKGPVVLVAEDDLAPGPLAGRWDPAGTTACVEPEPEAWFTGVGAGPEHSSVLELVNPDKGPAVADVTVLTPTGVADVSALRGIRVPGASSLTFDLGRLAPSKQDLALRVEVVRGRLGSSVLSVNDPVGGGAVTRSRVSGQPAPTTTSYLPGVGADWDEATLSVANPGDDEARVSLELVSGRSVFAPANAEEIRVAPGSVEQVDLDEVLVGGAGQNTIALRIEATAAVTATASGTRDGTSVHAVSGVPVEDRSGAVLPEGPKRIVLAGQPSLGTARVVARDRGGKVVENRKVELDPGRGVVVDLPPAAQVVVVTMDKTEAVGVVEVRGPRPSLVPLVPLPLTGQVPDVRPALD